MSKKPSQHPVESFASIKSMAYQQAGNYEASVKMAQFALDSIAGFPESIGDEDRKELNSGYLQRYAEKKPAKAYVVIDGNYIQPTPEQAANEKLEHVNIGVEFAFSYTSQEFGKLANDRPALHALIKTIRDDASTYCSNRLRDLKAQAKKILNQGKSRTRTANKDFAEYINATFEAMRTRCKNAKARGDNEANADRLAASIAAFYTKWNHAE